MSFALQRLALSCVAAVAAAAGCASEATPPIEEPTGTLELPLQQVGTDGAVYRLTADFQITGNFGARFVSTFEAAETSPSVTVTLPPGLVDVRLLDGWQLARTRDGGVTFEPVTALLATGNPVNARVLANVETGIAFQFVVRNPNGQITLSFGVSVDARELAGGVVPQTATGVFASYIGTRSDFAIYLPRASVGRNILADGSKQLLFTSSTVAGEFFNDPFGVLSNIVGPGFAGGFIEYGYVIRPDGTQELSGALFGGQDPFPELRIGPHVLTQDRFPVDAEGFPLEDFVFESFVPFTIDAVLAPTFELSSLSGQLRFRALPGN